MTRNTALLFVSAALASCSRPAPAPAPATPPASDPPSAPAPPNPISASDDDSPPRTRSGLVHPETDPDLPPAYGPRDAKVVVQLFSDFQCPVCRRAADATHQIAEEFPGQVRIEFWQNPLPIHPFAENAAAAALAAHHQGQFWPMHDALFRNQAALDESTLRNHAARLGLDLNTFDKDYRSPAVRERIRKEASYAASIGADGTPAFRIAGKVSVGWGSWIGFRDQVKRALP